MQWFNDLRLTAKLGIYASIMVIMAGVIGYAGFTGIRKVAASAQDLYAYETVPIGQIGRMAKDFQRIRANLAFMMLALDKADLDHDQHVVNTLSAEMDSLGRLFASTITDPELKRQYARYDSARSVFLPLQEKIISLVLAGQRDQGRALFMVGDARASAHVIEASIDVMMEMKRQSGEHTITSNEQTSAFSTSVVITVFVASLFIASVIGFVLARLMNKTLSTLVTAAEQIAGGDLTSTVTKSSNDEFGRLAGSFGQMVHQLRETMTHVARASEAVASASSEISSSTEQMAAGAQEQTSQSADVAAAVEEMSKTIVENSRNAAATADRARQAKEAAEQGGHVVGESIHGMNDIAETIKVVSQTVKELGDSGKQIGEIITVIDDIADQTNLLALNAAIEAARAGDQGRGFAVVADEVRKLAEKTTMATKEIASMIGKIQENTSWAVGAIEEGTARAGKGIQLAGNAGEALKVIVDLSQDLTGMVGQIAAANHQQSAASEQISKNVSAISSVSGETAVGAQQIARAAEDLNRLTEDLRKMLSRFKLNGANHV
ncbi:MAG TPA: methyl-accepting chemotaxis protein [Bacteroidota bacterium]|nr:methyl-accepting chemotaxis protein [Bacteroidota bacterium]